MRIFFLKYKNDMSFLRKIIVIDNIIYMNKKVEKYCIKNKMKIANLIYSIMQENGTKKLIIDKKIKEDKLYDLLNSKNVEIMNGRRLFKIFFDDYLDLLVKKFDLDYSKIKISILANDRNLWVDTLIRHILNKTLNVNIVSRNIDKYFSLQNEVFNNYGIVLIVNNNKNKSIFNSNIVINVDFNEKMLNSYRLFYNGILINVNDKVQINKKRFNGKIINDFDILIKEKSKLKDILNNEIYKDFDIKDLIEGFIYTNKEYLNDVRILI